MDCKNNGRKCTYKTASSWACDGNHNMLPVAFGAVDRSDPGECNAGQCSVRALRTPRFELILLYWTTHRHLIFSSVVECSGVATQSVLLTVRRFDPQRGLAAYPACYRRWHVIPTQLLLGLAFVTRGNSVRVFGRHTPAGHAAINLDTRTHTWAQTIRTRQTLACF